MKPTLATIPAALLPLLVAACSESEPPAPVAANSEPRIVTLGGDVTEVVFALGAGDQVVGADQGSLYPPQVLKLPRLNYHRAVSAEGVLSLEPALVLLTEEAGPETAIEQIRSAGIDVKMIPSTDTVEGAVEKIRSVAVALGEEERGEQLAATMTARLGEIESDVATMTDHPRVLFLYARQGMGAPMIGGTGSGADIMIELAGGVNAGAEIQGFSPLTPEALLDVRPDVVLMLDKGYDAIGGETGLLTLPGMAETPAGQAKRFVTVSDDLLLGFGARLPEAVETLAARIHESEAAAGE